MLDASDIGIAGIQWEQKHASGRQITRRRCTGMPATIKNHDM